jgi:hypothetical protein
MSSMTPMQNYYASRSVQAQDGSSTWEDGYTFREDYLSVLQQIAVPEA